MLLKKKKNMVTEHLIHSTWEKEPWKLSVPLNLAQCYKHVTLIKKINLKSHFLKSSVPYSLYL